MAFCVKDKKNFFKKREREKCFKPAWDSNPESPVPKTGAVSIRPTGLQAFSEICLLEQLHYDLFQYLARH